MGATRERIEIGEIEARRVFNDYFEPLLRFFRNRGASPEESEDLTQDTLLRVYRGMESFSNKASLRTWVYAIAHNVWRSARARTASRTMAAPVEPWPVALSSEGTEVPLDFAAADTTPEDWTRKRELDAVVERGLGLLAPGMRRCLELWLNDFTYAEIAELLQLQVGTVKSHLHSAKKRLEEHLRSPSGVGTQS